jgi:hypothetical protein
MTKKISYRYRGILFALIMSCCTAMIVSAIVIALHESSHSAFIKAWLAAFVTAWPIVFVAILLIAPRVNEFLDLFVEEDSRWQIDKNGDHPIAPGQ